jgi:DNA polymerase-3 subunit alpha
VLENLIKAGCFDFDNPNRSELLYEVDQMQRTKTQIKAGYNCPEYVWSDKLKAEWERESLGMYISIHPMERFGFKPFDTFKEEAPSLIGGEILALDVRKDKNGKDMAFATVGTLYGNVRVLVFGYLWARADIQECFEIGNLIMVNGKKSGDAILLDKVEVLE